MQIAKLIDANGGQIKHPKAFVGSVSWDAKEGKAFAWAADGKTQQAEMIGARVAWIGPEGMRIEGQEPTNLTATRFRLQMWQVIF